MVNCGEDFTFTWKIENFSCLPHQPGERLTSAEFIVESILDSKWCLWLYPRGYSDEPGKGKGCISLFLCNLERSPLDVRYSLLLETTDKVLKVPNWKNYKELSVDKNGKGKYKFILLSNLYESKHCYFPQDVLTVKCWLSPSTKNYKMPIYTKLSIVPNVFKKQCNTITRHEVQKKSLTWPIKNISKYLKKRKETTVSLTGAINTMVSLTLTFGINGDLNKEFAQIEIIVTDFPIVLISIFVKCKIAIITANKQYQNSIDDTHLFNSEQDSFSNTWIVPPFVKTDNLTAGKYLYLDDMLVLQCDFAFSSPGTKYYHVEVPQYTPWCLEANKTSINKLCGSFSHLFTNRDHCDISLQADGKTFPAHRLVLCARSPVFSAMFENDMKEKYTNVVDIADVDAETLERFLKFLYSDIMDEELTFEEACNLYRASDKYQVDLLKQQCSILLLSTLSVVNVCDVIILADAHKDQFLMSVVDNFLQFHSSETFNSKEWKNFMGRYPELSGRVIFKTWENKSFL